MKRANLITLSILVLIVSIFTLLLSSPVITAQNSGLQISPTKSSIDANPGDKKQVKITVKNLGQANKKFNSIFDNFTATDDESGQPKITSDSSVSSGIKTWLSGLSSISLNGGASSDYTVNVSVPAGTKSGTYYGTVRFNDATAGASVASILFINVGTITQQIAIEELDTTGITVTPLGLASGKFAVRLKNTGNGYTVPKLKIEILDDKKSVIEIIDANKDSGGILPNGTIRKYVVELSKTIEPNKTYSARVVATAGNNKPVTQEKDFVEAPVAAPIQTKPPEKNKSNLLPVFAVAIIALLTAGLIATILIKKRRKPDILPGSFSSSTPNEPSVVPTTFSTTPPTIPTDVKPEDKTNTTPG